MEFNFYHMQNTGIHAITTRIDQLWKQKKLKNRAALAEKLVEKGIRLSAFNRWWQTDNPPTTSVLLAIADLYRDVNLHWLITGTGDPFLSQSTLPVMDKKSPFKEYTRLETLISERVKRLETEVLTLKSEFEEMRTLIEENTKDNDVLPPSGAAQTGAVK